MQIKHKLFFLSFLFPLMAAGCSGAAAYSPNPALLSAGNVELTIVGGSNSFVALENTINSFSTLYPNCSIQYQHLDQYSDNIVTALQKNNDIDLFLTSGITATANTLPYAMELTAESNVLHLDSAYPGLITNATIAGDNGGLYWLPFGAEIRGMYVNDTLLKKYSLNTPTNYSEFLTACASLSEKGFIPLQGNPGSFGQKLFYPYICNLIANADDYDAIYAKVDACDDSLTDYFYEPFHRLYELCEKGYYNYKKVETDLGLFTRDNDTVNSYCFFDIAENVQASTDAVTYAKRSDVGQVAFMPGTWSLKTVMDKTKADFSSNIAYEFILSPMGDDGGFSYLSPSNGIAVNKNTTHKAWALEFLNYLFSEKTNITFAQDYGIIPNNSGAQKFVQENFKADAKHSSQLGQVTFRYNFFGTVKPVLADVSKANAQKYMIDNGDGTYSMHPFSYYQDELKAAFTKAKASLSS